LRVPTFRGGRGGKLCSTVGLGIELRGPSSTLGGTIGGRAERSPILPSLFSTTEFDIEVAGAPASCGASRLRKGFLEATRKGAADPDACGVIDQSV